MSRKWLEKESPHWVKQSIITQEQADRLLSLYAKDKTGIGILPILGSLLVGLSALSFVAANWQEMSHPIRFAIIVAGMLGFYFVGERFVRRGNDMLGIALVSIGLTCFGAGIFLIGQMFHMTASDATSFNLWGLAGVLLTYLYRSTFLFALAAVILNVGQFYSLSEFGNFSIILFAVLMAGLGYYWWQNRGVWQAWLLGLSAMLQSAFLIGELNVNATLYMIPVMALYVLGDWIHARRTAYPLQASALTAAFVAACVTVMTDREGGLFGFRTDELAQSLVFLAVVGAMLVLSLIGKKREGRMASAYEWLLLLPYFYASVTENLLYLLALCFYSLGVLWRGYAEEAKLKVNLGTALFLFSVLLAYVKLAWGLLDKSLFFLIGGVLLLGLSWYLTRRRSKFMAEEGADRDE